MLFRDDIFLLTVLDILFDAFVNQNVCKVVIGSNIKILACPQGICQTLIIIIQVEVQLCQ